MVNTPTNSPSVINVESTTLTETTSEVQQTQPPKRLYADFFEVFSVALALFSAIIFLCTLTHICSDHGQPLTSGYYVALLLSVLASWITVATYYFLDPVLAWVRKELNRENDLRSLQIQTLIDQLAAEKKIVEEEFTRYLTYDSAFQNGELSTGDHCKSFFNEVASAETSRTNATCYLAQRDYATALQSISDGHVALANARNTGRILKLTYQLHPRD